MRKTLIIALGAAVALVTAAVAVAVVPSAAGVSEVTATFSTGKAEKSVTRGCTGADNKAFQITNGRYIGTMVSANAVLNGPLTIDARTTYSPTDSLGYVEGWFRVKDDDSRVSGRFSGTLKSGKLVGFLTGASRGNHARVLGNLSAGFDPAGGFSGGTLGSASSGALAVIAGPVCRAKKSDDRKSDDTSKSDKHARPVFVIGKVTKLDPTSTPQSITVDPPGDKTPEQTCVLKPGKSPSLGDVAVNSQVGMICGPVDGKLTLLVLKKHS